MSTSAVMMMVLGVVIIWGGLAVSITNAVVKARRQKN
ncbi:methionine/alanine import family NSS transporter small subunit [Aeribacillus alveayuensis]|uniref:Methionine/alanine importer small subunit n=1 Tax=Aeribacillus alveayuensis TaxID=279215 RepID=A0ABT9VMF6_9BACI|nr:hypothetical protein [Bacillus alveayuensis]